MTRCTLSFLLVLAGCGGEGDPSAPRPDPIAAPEPEPPVEEPPAGPAGYTLTAHCARRVIRPTVGESRPVELTVRVRRGGTRVTMTIEAASFGWLCLVDRFEPGEERLPRGPAHVSPNHDLEWAEVVSRDHEELPRGSPVNDYDLFVMSDAQLEAIRDLQRRLIGTPRGERQELCAEALAHRVEVSADERDARVRSVLAGGPRNLNPCCAASVTRAVEGIRAMCSP